MRKQMLGDVVRSIVALIGLIALLGGMPAGLWLARGWPLPTSVPSIASLGDALGGATISDAVLLDALACLSWVVWALLAGCVVVEVVAWARGRVARSVPGAGAVQLLARRLVVSATLLVSVGRSATPSLAAAPAPVVAITPTPAATQVATADVEDRLPTCTVQPRDSLWRIAERHLGDPFRWREVYELNRGHTFGDGGVLRDPDLIRPGWELLLPEDAVGATIAMGSTAQSQPVTRSEPASPPPPSIATVEHEPAAPVANTATSSPDAGVNDDERVADDGDESASVPSRLATTTLLLAGVVATLTGLRRRQRRLREPGRMIRLPGPSTLRAERSVRVAADLEGADRLDLALRALASQARSAPRIDAVRVKDGEIEVLFAAPADGTSGPFHGMGSRAWVLPASTPIGELAERADRGCLAPALVSVGRAEAGDVLVDLEAGGPLTVHGVPEDVTAVLWSMVLDLATHAWADDVRVVVFGLDDRGLVALDRVEIAASVDALILDVADEARARAEGLARLGASSTWAARIASLGDGWAPTIVVLGPAVDASEALAASRQLEGCAGVAVVIASSVDAPVDRQRRLLVEPGCAHVALLPLDIVLEPAALPDDVLAALDDLIEVAADGQPGELLVQGHDDVVIDLRDPAPGQTASGVLVRIMGRVEIEGGKTKIDRRRAAEFVTLLALHPRGLTEGQIKAALWMDEEPTTNTFNKIVSRARVALGLDSTGEPHVRYVEDCVYKPGPELVTDWSILEAAWVRASRSGSPDDLAALGRAIDEVRGLPFEGTKGYEWAYEMGLPSRIEVVIDEARALLAVGSTDRLATG